MGRWLSCRIPESSHQSNDNDVRCQIEDRAGSLTRTARHDVVGEAAIDPSQQNIRVPSPVSNTATCFGDHWDKGMARCMMLRRKGEEEGG